MERYEAYKDSGIEWIGEIPEGWEARRIKTAVKRKSEAGHPDETVLSLYRDYGVVVKDSRDDNFNRTSENTAAYRFVEVDDLVVNKMKAWQGSLAVSGYRGIVSPAYYVYRIIDDSVLPRYMHYQLRDSSYLPEYRRLSGGIRPAQWDLSSDNFVNIPMLVPPLAEQECIADYLDAKTTKIDALVADCEREVELLQEYRKAVISEAVTKGLDPDAPMKDSGIEWIGEIPTDWCCAKLGLISSSTLGRMLDTEKQAGDCAAQYLSNRDVQWFRIDDSNLKEMDFPYDMRSSYEIHDGDMLVCEGGEVGRSTVWHGPTPAFYFQKAIHRVRFDNSVMNPDFAAYQMFQKAQVTMFREVRKGESTIGHLPGDQLRQLTFAVPPFEEQRQIVDYLDAKTAEIDSLIESKQSMADKLREYRRSLISEAVTGKFKVPGIE